MGIRKGLAQAVSGVSTAALKHVFRRPAANFPGKIALYVDPSIIGDMAYKLEKGSVIVVGTNGKTTTTNLLADALERAGQRVVCNRTGANLDSGVATSLLHASASDWGVFESDELWMVKVLPFLQSDYVLLLNLFRDQLDRVGEIDTVQESIVSALKKSPKTVLVYNADDPLCTAIADAAPNHTIPFGMGEDMHLAQNTVSDAQMCQHCSGMLEYTYRQYGQLGDFRCSQCDFARHQPAFSATDISLGKGGLRFTVRSGAATDVVTAPYEGAYMVYNLLATYVLAMQMGVPSACLQQAIDAFDPGNGRLQALRIGQREVLLNLAKNPTGFNQNLKLVVSGEGPKVAAFFINDREADGHDISWIWDVDFEELAATDDLIVYAGGIRRDDLRMRLKYAGIDARLADGAEQIMAETAQLPADYHVYMIANYTALPAVHGALTAMEKEGKGPDAVQVPLPKSSVSPVASAENPVPQLTDERPLRIVHLFPDLLNLYGDGGNPRVLHQRCLWRGVPVSLETVHFGETADLTDADIVFMGGGPDREQRLASQELVKMRDDLRAFVESDGVLLGICGGFQILGSRWLLGDESMEGLGILDVDTRRSDKQRIIDNIVLDSDLAQHPVVGYENHAGRTFLGEGAQPFGTVVNREGVGNNDDSGVDGARYRNVLGTYLHGPLLGKNPEIADFLLTAAIARRIGSPVVLPPLDDEAELIANTNMAAKLGVR